MLPVKVLAALLPAVAFAKKVETGFYSLKFDVSRGSSYDTSVVGAKARLRARDTDGTISMEIENESSFYAVDLKIGSTEQEIIVLVDTGSSDLWVTDSSNPYCSSSSSSSGKKYRNLDDYEHYQNFKDSLDTLESYEMNKVSVISSAVSKSTSSDTIDCSTYGTFDPSNSTTFTSNGTEFYISYGDSTFAYGTWGYDNVYVGDVEVENLTFAVANETNSTVGVLGIGLTGLETTYSGSLVSSGSSYEYANLPVKLVQDGLIYKRVYSLYLNSDSATSGNVLFGAVDHAKYEGSLTTVPVINTLKSSGYSTAIKLEVALTSMDYDGTSVSNDSVSALLDSGTTLTYVPSTIIESVASAVGAEYSDSYGYYLMDCPSSTIGTNLTFTFDGASIPVAIDNFILTFDSSGSTCVLGLMDSGDTSAAILGDSFLRSAYLVYDLDDLEIAMAPVKYTTDEDIEVVTSTIPSASEASDYSSTASIDSSDSTDLNGDLGGLEGSASVTTTTSGSKSTGTSTSTSSRNTASSSSSSSSSSGAPALNIPIIALFASLTVGLLAVCY